MELLGSDAAAVDHDAAAVDHDADVVVVVVVVQKGALLPWRVRMPPARTPAWPR